MFAAFANDIQEEKERITTEGSFEKEPIFYPDRKHHTYKFRAHPLKRSDGKGGFKLVLTRAVWSHSGFEKTRRLPCLGRDCPICHYTKQLKEIKHDEAWKYAPRKEYLMPVWIYESTAPKDYKWIRTGEYGYLVLRQKDYQSLNAFLATLSADEMKTVLNPKVKAPRLMFIVSPGSDGSSSFSFDLKHADLPPWPDDIPDLSTVYTTEDHPPTDDEMKVVKQTVQRLLAASSGTLMEPDMSPHENIPGEGSASELVSQTLGAAPNAPAIPTNGKRSCLGTAEGLAFGHNPQVLGGNVSVTCLTCPYENECVSSTGSN